MSGPEIQSAMAVARAPSLPAHLVPNPNLAWREIDGEIIIISPADSVAHELNETAGFIWRLLDSGFDAQVIADRVAAEFSVARDEAIRDTRELLALLYGKNLLVPASPEAK